MRPRRADRSTRHQLLSLSAGTALFCVGVALFAPSSCGANNAAEPVDPVRLDERIVSLVQPCLQDHFYDRPTADMIPVFIEKLQKGKGEALKRAKEELGAAGEEGAEEIRRFFDAHYTTALDAPLLENALDAASLNPTLIAHDILVRAIDHPMESVRQHAMLGMVSAHARPEDFELFLARLPHETPQMRRSLTRCMFLADSDRAEEETLAWFPKEENRDLWLEACSHIAASENPTTAATCAELAGTLPPFLAPWIAAPAARAGDEEAMTLLRNDLEAEDPTRRMTAVRALSLAGLVEEILATAAEDPDDQVRVVALEAVATAEPTRAYQDLLAASLDDGSPMIRGQAMRHLCDQRDPEALNRAIAQLSEDSILLQQALQALLEPMNEDPEIARRAFERLMERHALEVHRPIQQRTATYKAIGLVPLGEAARFLREIGCAAEGETIESLRAHDWLMIQASNTGPAGRATLLGDLDSEEDPLRRLDLISAVGSARDDAAREALLDILENRARSPEEVLFAASRLVKLGPARVVAPRLKQISYEIEDLEVRKAFQCLLWSYY